MGSFIARDLIQHGGHDRDGGPCSLHRAVKGRPTLSSVTAGSAGRGSGGFWPFQRDLSLRGRLLS